MYKIIIDADGIVYRVGFALEDVESERVVRTRVKEYIDYVVADITKVFIKVEKPIIVLSCQGKSNFRFELAKTLPYKGNRTADKPKHYDLIRRILSEMDNFVMEDGQEADDTVADLTSVDPSKTVVVSQDKDLLQNPGWYYIPGGAYMDYVENEDGEMEYTDVSGPKRPIFYVDPEATGSLMLEMHTGGKKVLFGTGPLWHYAQMLLGDPSDNIPGVKGYGAVKVYNTLKDADFPHAIVEQEYILAGLTMDRFNEIFKLLKIGGHKNGRETRKNI